MSRLLMICMLIMFSSHLYSQKPKKNVQYKYKKFERFDFEAMRVDSGGATPGDLSINPRFNVEFRNKLPHKPNFNSELMDSVEWLQ